MSVEDEINASAKTPSDTLQKALALFEDERWKYVMIVAADGDCGVRLLSSEMEGGRWMELGLLNAALLIVEKEWDDAPTMELDSL